MISSLIVTVTPYSIKKAAATPITADQMKKAKEYIAAGGNISAIESKYKLTDADKKELAVK